jgi:NAD(P)-dependent dehydrogenase (short-subunit alcohol dehydrogenase family)
MPWTAADIPDQTGRVALVTGANSGLGFQTSRRLAGRGATVLMACRSAEKAAEAIGSIRAEHPGAAVELVSLDLADLASVRKAADEALARHSRLDLLVNNAGVMALPYRVTADGFEMQLGTNHLGHFALTGHLIDRLLETEQSRIVNVSSGAHRMGAMRWDDLHGRQRYRKWPAYGQSKLANLLFTRELQRRLAAAGSSTLAAAAHPGYAATHLQAVGPEMSGSSLMRRLTDIGNSIAAQSDEMGALPLLYAATAPGVQGGEYFGPDGIGELRGHPRRVGMSARARSDADARRLWQVSEDLTGVTYASLPA